MVILRVLLDGARTENSLEPEQANDSVRVPPPPQPSFFTATVILQNRREEIFHYLEEGELRERINELFFILFSFAKRAGSPQQHLQITVGSFLPHPPCQLSLWEKT